MVTRRGGSSFLALNRKNTIAILDKFGRKDITLKYDTETYNENGGLSGVSTTTETITGDLQFVSFRDKDLLSEGYVRIGDGVFYTVFDENLKENYEITVSGVTWKLKKQIEAETISEGQIYQAWTCVRRDDS